MMTSWLTCSRGTLIWKRSTSTLNLKSKIEIRGKLFETDSNSNLSPAVLTRVRDKSLIEDPDSPICQIVTEISRLINIYRGTNEEMVLLSPQEYHPVVPVKQNFDDLMVDLCHPSRSPRDTYYVNGEYVLRTHTTAHDRDAMRKGYKKFLLAGDVFRRDCIDKSHMPVFHQMDGVCLFSRNDILRILSENPLDSSQDGMRSIDLKVQSNDLNANCIKNRDLYAQSQRSSEQSQLSSEQSQLSSEQSQQLKESFYANPSSKILKNCQTSSLADYDNDQSKEFYIYSNQNLKLKSDEILQSKNAGAIDLLQVVEPKTACRFDDKFLHGKSSKKTGVEELNEKNSFHTTQLDKQLVDKVIMRDLRKTLEALVTGLFGCTPFRWCDTTFPFTDPSIEIEILKNSTNKLKIEKEKNTEINDEDWLEILGAGLLRPEVIAYEGSEEIVGGWAFGLGLDRLVMVLHNIPDIRLLWTEDVRFRNQFLQCRRDLPAGGHVQFKPFSVYPPIIRDVSFFTNPGHGELDVELEFCELVRGVAGDLVEQVKLIDVWSPHAPDESDGSRSKEELRRGKSMTFRVIYRSMDRTLTDELVNDIQSQVRSLTSVAPFTHTLR